MATMAMAKYFQRFGTVMFLISITLLGDIFILDFFFLFLILCHLNAFNPNALSTPLKLYEIKNFIHLIPTAYKVIFPEEKPFKFPPII